MPKLPHSEPLTAELSGAVDSGAHAVDRRIGKTLSAYFLTEQAAFFILITLVKNTAAAIFGRTEDTVTDKKLISSLQGLRAVAFLSVILSHCGAPWLGPWAISVFVALSGFLMTCNYYDRPRTAPGLRSAMTFSLQKIRKLYPLHLIMMVAALLLVLKGLLGAALCPRGAVLCSRAWSKHFPAANMDPLQPFLVLLKRSRVVSFGAGFSVCYFSRSARPAEKSRYSQAALHRCRDFLRTIPFLPCNLEGRTQWKVHILPDLSVSSFPGRRFCHQLLYGLPLPQPQGGAHTARCLFPSGAGSCAVFGRLLFHRCQTGRSFGRGSLPVQRAVHPLCGAAGLAARRGQGSDFPAAFRKAVFVAGRAVALRLSDSSGTDPVYGVGCKQAWSYGTSCGLDPDRIFAHTLPEQLLQGVGAPGAEASCQSCRAVKGIRLSEICSET